MQRKTLSVVIAVLIGLLSLVACHPSATDDVLLVPSEDGSEVVSTVEPTDTQSVQALSLIPVDETQIEGRIILVWHPWVDERANLLDDLIRAFNAQNEYGLTVVAQSHSEELYQDFYATFGTDNMPDIVVGYVGDLFEANRYGDMLVDLLPYLNDAVWGLTDDARRNLIGSFFFEDNGEMFTFPLYRAANLLYYNQSWAEELGFATYPETPQNFRQQACAAADALNNGMGGWLANTNPTTILSWIYAFGGDVLSPDKRDYQFANPMNEKAFVFLKELADENCLWLNTEGDPLQKFAERKALFLSASALDIPFVAGAFDSMGSEDDWRVLPYPSENMEPVMIAYGADAAVIRSDLVQQTASWVFIKWLIAAENQAKWQTLGAYLPVNKDAVKYSKDSFSGEAAWLDAMGYSTVSRQEPMMVSWHLVRWALSDAAKSMLLDADFSTDDVAVLLETLSLTANEIQVQHR